MPSSATFRIADHLGTIGFVPARSPIPRNALAGGSAPLDLIGHAAHRFDSARRLDPGVVRAILESELPTAFTALERMP
jgi:hypothetical protein